MNTLQHAKHLVSLGFSVFPLVRDSKIPAVKWKELQTRKPTDNELDKWFSGQGHDIAIVTGSVSQIAVIDCDSKEAQTKAAELKLCSPVAQVTKRGCHFVHKFNGQCNSTKAFGVAGIDCRGEGGYIKAYEGSKYWQASLLSRLESSQVDDKKHSGASQTRRINPKASKQFSDTGVFAMRIINDKAEEPIYYEVATLPNELLEVVLNHSEQAFSANIQGEQFAFIRCY